MKLDWRKFASPEELETYNSLEQQRNAISSQMRVIYNRCKQRQHRDGFTVLGVRPA